MNVPAKKKNQKIIGMEIITDMEYDSEENEYSEGEILDPESGNVYDCKLWIENGKLKVLWLRDVSSSEHKPGFHMKGSLELLGATHDLELLNQELTLDASKAFYWHEERALVLADVHLGKAGHFRKHGVPIPRQVSYFRTCSE